MDLDLPYFAGIIDGEGCMSEYKRKNQYDSYFVIEVGMTDIGIVRALHAKFGGSFRPKPAGKPGHKAQWRWRVCCKQARSVYAQLEPYLRLKRVKTWDGIHPTF